MVFSASLGLVVLHHVEVALWAAVYIGFWAQTIEISGTE